MIRTLMASTAVLALLTTGALAQQQPAGQPQPQAQQPAASEQQAQPPEGVKQTQEQGEVLVDDLLGKTVYSGQAEDAESIGDISDLVLDEQGQVSAVVIGVGGFLGIGQKDVALNFEELQFTQDQNGEMRIVVNATEEQLEAAPEFEKNEQTRLYGGLGEQERSSVRLPEREAEQPTGQQTAEQPERQPSDRQAAQQPERQPSDQQAAQQPERQPSDQQAAQQPERQPSDQQAAQQPSDQQAGQQQEQQTTTVVVPEGSGQQAQQGQEAGQQDRQMAQQQDRQAGQATDQQMAQQGGQQDRQAGQSADQQMAQQGQQGQQGQQAAGGQSAEVVFIEAPETGESRASQWIGKQIVTAEDEEIGEVQDLLVDESGSTEAVIVDVSGFVESEKQVAIPFDAIQVEQQEGQDDPRLVANLSQDELKQAPAFQPQEQAAGQGQQQGQAGQQQAEKGQPQGEQPQGQQQAAGGEQSSATGGAQERQAARAPGVEQSVSGISADQLMGADVIGGNNEEIGQVGDVVFSQDGQIRAVVVDVGGFLGIGAKEVAIQFDAAQVQQQEGELALMIPATEEQLEQAPEYQDTAELQQGQQPAGAGQQQQPGAQPGQNPAEQPRQQ